MFVSYYSLSFALLLRFKDDADARVALRCAVHEADRDLDGPRRRVDVLEDHQRQAAVRLRHNLNAVARRDTQLRGRLREVLRNARREHHGTHVAREPDRIVTPKRDAATV